MPLIKFENLANEPELVQLVFSSPRAKLLTMIMRENANIIASNGCSILAIAADRGDLELVTALLSNGAKTDTVPAEGKWHNTTVLMFASASGNLKLVSFLLTIPECKATVKNNNTDKHTAFTFAAIRGHTEIMQCLSNEGTTPSIDSLHKWRSASNGTLLMWAVIYNQFSGLKYLLSLPGFPEIINHAGKGKQTALIIAVEFGFKEMVLYLQQQGASTDINRWVNEYGSNLLMFAVLNAASAGIEYMLSPDNGFDFKEKINISRKDGHTALTLAAISGHSEVVELLEKKGATNNLAQWRNINNSTILMVAAMNGSLPGIRYLLKIPSIASLIDAKNIHQLTALNIAAVHGHANIVKELEKAGAHETTQNFHEWRDSAGNTLLSKAASNSLEAGMKYLMQFPKMRSLINHANKDGHTALELTLPDLYFKLQKQLDLVDNKKVKTADNYFELKKEILLYFEKSSVNRVATIITSYVFKIPKN